MKIGNEIRAEFPGRGSAPIHIRLILITNLINGSGRNPDWYFLPWVRLERQHECELLLSTHGLSPSVLHINWSLPDLRADR